MAHIVIPPNKIPCVLTLMHMAQIRQQNEQASDIVNQAYLRLDSDHHRHFEVRLGGPRGVRENGCGSKVARGPGVGRCLVVCVER